MKIWILGGLVLLAVAAAMTHPAGKPPSAERQMDSTTGEDRSRPQSAPSKGIIVPGDLLVPTYLGGPERRTYGRGPVPERLDVLWKLKIGGGWTRRKEDDKRVLWKGMGWTGQPLLVREAGRLCLIAGGYDHNLRKIDALTGKVVWAYECDDVIKGTPTVFVNPAAATSQEAIIVVMGSRRGSDTVLGDPGIAPVRAVSFETGRELWRMPVPRTACYSQDCDASGLVAGGVLYQAVESGYVYALDSAVTSALGAHRTPAVLRRSPELFDEADVGSHADTPQGSNVVLEGSPALLGGRLYIGSGSGHVYGLSTDDLSVVWDFRVGADVDSTMVVNRDGRLLFGIEKEYVPGRGGVFMVDPSRAAEEAIEWFFPTENRAFGQWQGGVVGSVAINDDYDADGAKPPLAAFISVDGYLYVVSQDTLDGAKIAGPDGVREFPTPVTVFKGFIGAGISTPLIVDDHIVACGYDKRVHVYRISHQPHPEGEPGGLAGRDRGLWDVSIREVGTFTAAGPFEATPLVWEGRIYVGCRDGYLYCLGGR